MHLRCSKEEFASAQELVSGQRCQPASRAQIGTPLPITFLIFLIFSARFLIWIGSDQERTFGPTITGLIHKHIEPERMILWDSKKRGGRPDTVQLLKDTWASFGAEVIFITSNMQGNDEMMQGCRAGTYISIRIHGNDFTNL